MKIRYMPSDESSSFKTSTSNNASSISNLSNSISTNSSSISSILSSLTALSNRVSTLESSGSHYWEYIGKNNMYKDDPITLIKTYSFILNIISAPSYSSTYLKTVISDSTVGTKIDNPTLSSGYTSYFFGYV